MKQVYKPAWGPVQGSIGALGCGMWDVAGEASLHPSAKASPVLRYNTHAMLYQEQDGREIHPEI